MIKHKNLRSFLVQDFAGNFQFRLNDRFIIDRKHFLSRTSAELKREMYKELNAMSRRIVENINHIKEQIHEA